VSTTGNPCASQFTPVDDALSQIGGASTALPVVSMPTTAVPIKAPPVVGDRG